MPINHPYDPRYNAKIYVPKLTEEERRARATPLENLKGLGFRSQPPAAPVEVPVPAESVTQAPAPEDSAAPQAVPESAPAPDYRATALEVAFAEFPLVPKLCLVEDVPGRRMQSPELRPASPPIQSSPRTPRAAPLDQRLRV